MPLTTMYVHHDASWQTYMTKTQYNIMWNQCLSAGWYKSSTASVWTKTMFNHSLNTYCWMYDALATVTTYTCFWTFSQNQFSRKIFCWIFELNVRYSILCLNMCVTTTSPSLWPRQGLDLRGLSGLPGPLKFQKANFFRQFLTLRANLVKLLNF